jgi:transposase-like protein
MKSSEKFRLENEVHVDKFEIGTPQKGEQGRSKSKKKVRVIIALEYRNGSVVRGYAKVIDNYSSKSLKPIFEVHIKKDAKVVTDGWSGYKPMVNNYPNLKQRLSNKAENFTMLHLQIRNFKNWLRGVHSYCSKMNINKYFYSLYRLNFISSLFFKLIERMTLHLPTTYKSITKNVA